MSAKPSAHADRAFRSYNAEHLEADNHDYGFSL